MLEAPDDLVVRFEEGEGGNDFGRITLRRLNASRNGQVGQVKLVVLDAQGGRTEITIEVERPSLLPEIVPPNPLFIAEGQTQTRPLELAGATDMEVTWEATPSSAAVMAEVTEDGARVSVTALVDLDMIGALTLTLTATAANGVVQKRQAFLPVVVVAAAPKPRLQLKLSAADPADPEERVTISSFLLTETLYIGASIEGDAPNVEVLTVTILIEREGEGDDSDDEIIVLRGEFLLSEGESSIEIPVTATMLEATPELMVGEVVLMDIGPDFESHGENLDGLITGGSLSRVVAPSGTALGAIRDSDNDGLVDLHDDDAPPSALGPLSAAVVAVTDSGAEVQAEKTVSLSLGGLARALGLGQCGGVSLTLTLSDGGNPVLHGCDEADLYAGLDDEGLAAVVSANEQFAREETGEEEVQLIDLSATFDSSDAGPDEPLVINLPFDPESYRVYRYDEASDRWVLVIGVILSGQGSGGAGALEDVNEDCQSCFYAADPDRDGSVELLLLVQTVEPELSFAVTSNEVVLDSVLEVTNDATLTLALTGLEGEVSVRVVQVGVQADERGHVAGFFVQTATIGGNVGPAVELRGLRRTRNGPEEVQVLVTNSEGETVTATFYVTVANQPPVIKFMLDGEETTSIKLQPGVEVMLEVVFEDPDGDTEFRLELTPEDGGGVAQLVPRLVRGVGSAEDQIENLLFLTSDTPRAPFTLSLKAMDVSDDSPTTAPLTVCVLGEDGECPAATGGGSGGSGGGGGGSGLLWLLLLAPAVLVRLRQRPHASTSLLA